MLPSTFNRKTSSDQDGDSNGTENENKKIGGYKIQLQQQSATLALQKYAS